jgi:hypothetical protein
MKEFATSISPMHIPLEGVVFSETDAGDITRLASVDVHEAKEPQQGRGEQDHNETLEIGHRQKRRKRYKADRIAQGAIHDYDWKQEAVVTSLSPSFFTVEALREVNCHDVLPFDAPSSKKDLSYNNPRAHETRRRPNQSLYSTQSTARIGSLALIMSKFIRADGAKSSQGSSQYLEISRNKTAEGEPGESQTVLTPESLVAPELVITPVDAAHLQKRGYAPRDARFWAHILMKRSAEDAASAVHKRVLHTSGIALHTNKAIPLFVLGFLLRRKRISASALRLLLPLIWDALHLRSEPTPQCLDRPPCRNSNIGNPISAKDDKTESNQESLNATSDGDLSNLSDTNSGSKYQSDGEHERLASSRDNAQFLLNDQAAFTLFIRLARHARIVWPAGLVNISALAATFLLRRDDNGLPLSLAHKQLARITYLCNRALKLLSIETSVSPMKSAIYQQRAQFDLIRAMLQYQPSLPVTREGHYALTTVLLRLKKTSQERDWGSLKSKSWPPFKESKTRLDDMKDSEYGLSRAAQAIRFMQEYGYELRNQDVVAQILSGWHPDGSPTIQVRAHLQRSHPSPQRHRQNLSGDPTEETESKTTAAMIESTRTLEEAWACFLDYQQRITKRSPPPYLALMRKILADRGRHQMKDSNRRSVWRRAGPIADSAESLPGDGRETVAASESPAEAVYIPRPPPTFEEFLEMTVTDGIRFTDRDKNFIMSNAPSLEIGLRIWGLCGEPLPGLLRGALNPHEAKHRAPLSWPSEEVPLPRVENSTPSYPVLTGQRLASLLALLCRFSDDPFWYKLYIEGAPQLKGYRLRRNHGVTYALHLLRRYQPSYGPAWMPILKALTRPNTLHSILYAHLHNKRLTLSILTIYMVEDVVRQMKDCNADIGTAAFGSICFSIGRSVSQMSALAYIYGRSLAETMCDFGLSEWSSSRPLRKMFAELVGIENHLPVNAEPGLADAVSPIPSILNVPNPAELHQYVRVLGIYGDHEGILSLVKWMVQVEDELAVWVDAELNGQANFRKLLSSIAVMLGAPERYFKRRVGLKPADEDLIELVRREIESVEAWGGWPSGPEIDLYCAPGEP